MMKFDLKRISFKVIVNTKYQYSLIINFLYVLPVPHFLCEISKNHVTVCTNMIANIFELIVQLQKQGTPLCYLVGGLSINVHFVLY